jgi:tetratricopeptide (TPR) repeat protein
VEEHAYAEPPDATDIAARHLLHNIRNAKALRTNPLVAHLLLVDDRPGAEQLPDRVVVSRVTQAIATVLRSLDPAEGNPFDGDRSHRQAEIVRRCVIGTEPYKAVARDLGISLRTLFRDLDGIRLRLAEDLPRYTPPLAAIVNLGDNFDLELRYATLQRNMGRFDEALSILDQVAGDSSSQIQRARAYNASAVTLVDSGETDKAIVALDNARRTLAALDTSERQAALTESEVELTSAMIARVKGDTPAAFLGYERSVRKATEFVEITPSTAIDILVRAHAQSAVLRWLIGDIESAGNEVEGAWNELERLDDPPDDAHYALLAASSMVHLVKDGDVAWAMREMSAAAVLAERRGMLHDALMALGWLASMERLNGNSEGAAQTTRRTIGIAKATMKGTEFALLSAAAAETLAEVGDLATATRLIAEGRARVQPGGAGWARLELAEASMLLLSRRYAEALAVAQRAGEAMQRQGKAGFVGYAYLLRALAHEGRGERAQALLAVRESLPLMERLGKSPELVAAYELSARLTGNRTHKANALDLARLLRG